MASAISKKTELKLTGVARASLEELLLDYEDFHGSGRGCCKHTDLPDQPGKLSLGQAVAKAGAAVPFRRQLHRAPILQTTGCTGGR